ncbi:MULTISPECIES: fumarylacetoacetase [Psychrobacter]|jgi:fumarylacetoacetase|uniref:fumarylacetoacetase n=1 Tax=Psychrobacter TaxID=497 RepID=UPI0007F3BC16|nr:fumarylacetoacetase [Psychrobacter sp. Ps5]OAP71052.1 fumarylacetoacetase [Psychrobacter sp. SHUES1]PKG84619.1 fumarylacetoacetase [Psychrobacter sp. Sarcosine-02u-2]HCR87862.1 fumarylacetoacetase [Psychrobacter sp.]
MSTIDKNLTSFIDIAADSDFSIHNLPYGIFSDAKDATGNNNRRAGVAIGEQVLDLSILEAEGLLSLAGGPYFDQPTLNAFIDSGRGNWTKARSTIQTLLSADSDTLRDNKDLQAKALFKQADVTMHLPVHVPGFTDFYSSKEHATNVGTMFRDPKNALLANWTEMPVGYNGRASTVIVSGTDVIRPSGQLKPNPDERPIFSPCKRLDFELETAFVVGKGNNIGQPIAVDEANDHIFGMVLLNDWSARDIQKWEYVPLGPFNAKTFASEVSPWIVTMDALAPFKTACPTQEPKPLAYLNEKDSNNSFDINLSVELLPENSDEATVVCETNFKYMYWSMAQQLTHHTITGCKVEVGDMMGSGTISGPTPDSYGSMLEIAWNATKPVTLKGGETRSFIEDGDTVIMKGYSEKDGIRVGFGEVRGKVLPALSFDFDK